MSAGVPSEESSDPLHPERLTWAALLGRWVEFAESALALPRDEEGRRLRESVPDIVMLQAVTFALENLTELDERERSLGLDRAEVLIEKHEAALRGRWRGEELPSALRELIEEARAALWKSGGSV